MELREDGVLTHGGIVIGSVEEGVSGHEPRIVLNLGWMRMAHVHLRVEDDPSVERHRNGVVLER